MSRWLAAAGCCLALAACGGAVHRTTTAGNGLDALSAAISATDTTRAAVLAAVHGEDTAVGTADDADEDALAGDTAAAGPLVPRAAAGVAAASTAAAGAARDVTAYRAALEQLGSVAATAPLAAAQRRAVQAVVADGLAEAGALGGTVAAYAAALPTYRAVVLDLQTWETHVQAGFFSTAAESGGAYQVQRTPQAAALDRDRAAIAAADGPRRRTAAAMAAALDAARQSLASLS